MRVYKRCTQNCAALGLAIVVSLLQRIVLQYGKAGETDIKRQLQHLGQSSAQLQPGRLTVTLRHLFHQFCMSLPTRML